MKNETINYIKSLKIYDESTRKEAFILLDLLDGQKKRDSLLENRLKTMIKDFDASTKASAKISALDEYSHKYELTDEQHKIYLEQVFKKFEKR